ncbi:DUF3987 domain-containing protein [Nostoc sp. FACHB-87]|uniref:DUF3987 domain-containing protein n=1 Tax=Nostocaceae TaxID=1162 RepID=UPI00168B3E7D|nr:MULTISPECIES: DUF3987 domain-containing protein [Nostocaceae]MBD2453224.1 DUF3987 domain-containing protein [Nostoc sp. FACHB-87]MBD2474996.1 DUF3987 domain-containing protein [Anabaena sp. FACHB-83]
MLLDIDNSKVDTDEKGQKITDGDGRAINVLEEQLTIEDALKNDFIRQHCALAYTTASHKETWPKFRLVFPLPECIFDVEVVEACTRLLMQHLPHDPACKDASRVFYGNTNADLFILNPYATLPKDWIKKAKQLLEQEKAEKERRRRENEERYKLEREQFQVQGWDEDLLIDQALRFIPPRCYGSNNYQECLQVLMALTAHYGASKAEAIAEAWSPSQPREGDKEWNIAKKIRSFRRDGIAIGTLFYIAKQHGFAFPKREYKSSDRLLSKEEWEKMHGRTEKQAIASKPNNVVQHPTAAKLLSGDELLDEIDNLIDSNIGRSQLEAKILDLATRSVRTSNEIWRLYKTRDEEETEILDREVATKQLPTLLEAQRASLSPDHLLWGDGGKLAYLLKTTAESMPVAVEALLTTLFPVAGSRIGTSSRLIVNARTNYTVTPIFWSCVVSKTGTLKSPAQKVVVNPLDKLEAQEYHNWKTASEDYKKDLKRCGKGDELPDEPAPRKRFIVQGCTTEARMKIHGENPRGLLYYRDEWASFITGRNKYRGGKGDDAQLDLSEFNGDALYKDVVDGEKCIYLEHSAISRTGNTQPEILKKFQSEGNFADYAGEFARWLYCCKESPIAFIDLFADDDGIGKLLNDDLSFLYQYLGRLPERDYFLSPEAKRIYQAYQHQLMKWLAVEEHSGLAATYPKLQTYLGRFALWLHLVNAVLSGESTPHQIIDARAMQAAVHCVDFYLAQARLMYAQNSDQQAIAGNLLKIKEYIEKHPEGVTVRKIRSGIYSFRKTSPDEINQGCLELVGMRLIKQVAKTYYPLLSGDDDSDDEMMINHHHPKTIGNKGIYKNDDGDDQKIINFQELTNLDKHLMDDDENTFISATHHQPSSLLETPIEQASQRDDDISPQIITIIENTEKVLGGNKNSKTVSTAIAPLPKVGEKVLLNGEECTVFSFDEKSLKAVVDHEDGRSTCINASKLEVIR